MDLAPLKSFLDLNHSFTAFAKPAREIHRQAGHAVLTRDHARFQAQAGISGNNSWPDDRDNSDNHKGWCKLCQQKLYLEFEANHAYACKNPQ